MKKYILILLFFTSFLQSQTYPVNPTPFGKITINTNVESTTATKISVQEDNNRINWLRPENIPISQPPHPINYSITLPTLGAHLIGIDTRLGTIVQTTAGTTARVYFTGDNTTVNSVVYFASSLTGKGSVASVSPTALVNGDNQKQYYTKDIIGVSQPSVAIAAAGTYSGQLSVMVDSDVAQERYTVEIYKTNSLGAPIASGISGAPTGSLGVTVVAILDSGIIDLTANSLTNISVSGLLASQLTINTGERLRYHVSAEKVGTAGANVTFNVYYGSNHSSYYDVPITPTTDTVLNKSAVTGITSTDALNALNTNKENTANKQNSLAVDGTGVKFPTVDAINNGVIYKRTIAQIRALSGALPNNNFYTTDLGQEGNWYYDASDVVSTDNTGTILVTADGKRVKRVKEEVEELKSSWFETPNGSTDLALFNKILTATTKKLIIDKGTFNLQASTVSIPSGKILVMKGGFIINTVINGSNTLIECDIDYEPINALFTGTFSPSSKVFYYKTMQDAKLKKQWCGKRIKTGGFWYENDGGGATYTIISKDEGIADNSFFQGYWADTDIAGGAGLFVKFTSFIFAKYTGKTNDIDLAVFGVKYDAFFLNPADKKYYTTASYTTLATDNYEAVRGAIGQLAFWSKEQLSRNLILSRTLIINTKLTLKHGGYNFSLKGGGYGENSIISSNSNLDALIENYYSDAAPNDLTGLTATFSDIAFKGNGRIANGMVVKNGYEVDALDRLEFHDFTNAGLVFYGVSSTFKVGTVSCFRNKYGILITSTHPYRLSANTSNSDGLISLYRVSGDFNTDALISIDCTSLGTSLNIQSVKSENNNNATILIKRSSVQQYISVRNAFTNGDGDFLKIENYVGELPTIELEGIFHNDTDADNWDINDLKNSKQIRLFKNPTGAFPHIIYTNDIRAYENGHIVYRNGNKSNLEPTRSFGTTADRPANVIIGYKYYDTTISREVVWNGTSWVDIFSSPSFTGTTSLGTFTVGTLPTPTTPTAYATVTNALAPTYMATVVGGGSVVCPVFFDGVSWKAH